MRRRSATSVLLVAFVLAVGAPASAQSPPGSAGAKAAGKCQQTIGKVNAKFLTQRLKRLATCSNAVLGCVETQPGVAACVAKATAKCGKQLGSPDVADPAAVKLEAAVVKACGALPLPDLLSAGGLDFGDAAAACAEAGVPTLASAADVAHCLQLLHANLSEEAYGAELPRAAELTAEGGVSALVVPDLPVFDGCGDCGTPPPAGKAVAACGAAIAKAGGSFLAKARAGLDKCAAALVGCAQTKPGDAGCLAKASATCQRLPADLTKARSAVAAALAKKCAGALAFPTLDAPPGIDLGALDCECQQVGVAPVATLDDYALCLTRQHECGLAAVAASVVPTLDDLLAGQGLVLGDLVCPPAGTAADARFVNVFGSISKFFQKALPGSLVSSASPLASRGFGRRVGFPLLGCHPGSGRSCLFRFPITKRPPGLLTTRGAASAPTLLIAVKRADGTFTDDHFEVPLGDTTNDSEMDVELTYADALTACNFDLALAVQECGEVSSYTTVAQQPHPLPANDECGTARGITTSDFTEVLDTTEATAVAGDPTCAPGEVANTVWYQFTAPASGNATVDTFGSDFDSVVSVLPGSCTGTANACSNDSDGTPQSKVVFQVSQGTTYFIAVGEVPPVRDTSTLHFAFHFIPGGSAPTVGKVSFTLLELNNATGQCQNNGGSLFQLDIDYDDPDGDVSPATAGALISAQFEPSGTTVAPFPDPLQSVSGDGFKGTATTLICNKYNNDTTAVTTVRLAQQSGASNAVTIKIPRPAGAL